MDNAGNGIERYLSELELRGQRLEAEALNPPGDGGRAFMVFVFGLLFAGGLLWCLYSEQNAEPLQGGMTLAGIGLIGGLLMLFSGGGGPRSIDQRELLYAHIHERVFSMGQLRQYIAGQRGAAAGRADSALSPQLLESFIDFFLASSFVGNRGYRFLGRSEHSHSAVRALLMQVLARELLQGFSAFSEGAEEVRLQDSPAAAIGRDGWRPPPPASLQDALGRVLRGQLAHVRMEAALYFSLAAVLSFVTFFGFAHAFAISNALPLSGAAALLIALLAHRVASIAKLRSLEAYKLRMHAQLEWDIFHNGLLRDFVHTEGQYREEELLYRFAAEYTRGLLLAERNRNEGMPLQLVVMEVVLRGLLSRLHNSPHEFEQW